MNRKFIATLVLAATMIATPALAQFPMTNTPMKMGTIMFQGINLSAQQQKEIQKIRDRYNLEQTRQTVRDNRPFADGMQEILLAETFDETKARDFLTRRSDFQNEMQLQQMKQQHEMLQVLTPEQKQTWQKNRAQRQKQIAQQFKQGRTMKSGKKQGQTSMHGNSNQACPMQ